MGELGVAGTIEVLFPAFVRSVLAPVDSDHESGDPDEHRAVAGAVFERRQEFLCGRACAHAALQALGHDARPIGIGWRRQPMWPAGVVGSISHARGLAGAAVALAADVWALGFDIEALDPPLPEEVEQLVVTDGDLDANAVGSPDLARYVTKLVFSAKESVYKCLFPRTRWPLTFADVTVTLDLAHGRYAACLDRRFQVQGRDLSAMEGRIVATGEHIFTALCLPAEPSLPSSDVVDQKMANRPGDLSRVLEGPEMSDSG